METIGAILKAVISNRIYMSKPEEGFDSIKEALTYKLIVPGQGSKPLVEIIRNYKVLPRDIISIPQGRLDLVPANFEIIDKRTIVTMPFPEPRIPLRPEQQEVYEKVDDTCFINAMVGWGKTFTALHIARKLEQKTLIITHTAMLRDQWAEKIQEIFGISPATIGSSNFDLDSSIVVGNIQTVSKHSLALCKEFGTVIMDEAHHCPASTFTNIIDSSYARYRIGLSGTMQRKDGKHVLFADYFGNQVFKPPKSNTLNPRIKLVRSGIQLTPGVPWAKKINNLLYDTDYQQYIATIAASQVAIGHKVLIVADRVEFLSNIKELLGEKCMLVTGESSLEERNSIGAGLEAEKISCIAGSRQIFSEGISIDILSCIILATPVSNEALLRQLIGRIMRKHPNKKDPVVIDIQFSSYADRKQNNLRLGVYMEEGWDIQSL